MPRMNNLFAREEMSSHSPLLHLMTFHRLWECVCTGRYLTLVQYSIQTSYSLSLDAMVPVSGTLRL